MTLLHVLLGLDYLHTEAGIVHTGMLALFASNAILMCSLWTYKKEYFARY